MHPYDQSPFVVPLSQDNLSTLALPQGNYGNGVHISRMNGKWHLEPGTNEWRPPRRKRKRESTVRTLGSLMRDMRSDPQPIPLDLDEVVLSPHPADRWEVVGHWNLAGAWRIRGTEDWPFGGQKKTWEEVQEEPSPKLVACLPDGTVFVPRIPSFQEAEAWVIAQDLSVPETQCDCGKVHWGAGKVVGLLVSNLGFPGKLPIPNVNLIVQEHCRKNFHGKCPEMVLDLRICAWLHCVEPGGMSPLEWMRTRGDEEARTEAERILEATRKAQEENEAQWALLRARLSNGKPLA